MTKNLDYSFLSQDSGSVAQLRGTTDTVYQCTASLENFLQVSFAHCANDLWCSGARVKYAFLNLGLNASIKNSNIDSINESLAKILSKHDTMLVNAHTYYSDTCVISWTLLGDGYELEPLPTERKLGLYLSDTLGLGYLLQNDSSEAEDVLINRTAKNCFSFYSKVYEGTTDISGFGLFGSIISVCERYKMEACLNLSRIPISLDLSALVHEKGVSCSAKQNLHSFSSYFDQNFSNEQNQILFGGEVNGPILIISDLDEAIEDRLIGYINPSSKAGVKIIGY